MNNFIKKMVEPVTGKAVLGDCSADELKKLVETYPFFGPAHFLFHQKTKREDHTSTDAFYFHNAAWYRFISTPENTVHPHTVATVQAVGTITETEGENIVFTEQADSETPENVYPDHTTEEPEIKIPALKIEPIDPATAELSFTPYHTVDYFASQGIKLKEEGKPTDRFEKQLRSFTDWLKAMKKLPASESDISISSGDEQKVTKMAGDSLAEEKVDTEAMAEVWEKQGQPEKAKEIYRKLSLSNPGKSAYFAAKIENLE